MIPNPARLGGAKRCPLKGFVRRKVEPVAPGELAAPIRVRVGRERVGLGVKGVSDQRRVTFSFRAARSADTQSYYTFETHLKRRGRRCASSTSVGQIAKDVRAGEIVTYELLFPYACRGRLELKVGYVQQRRPDSRRVYGLGNDRVGTVVADIP